MFRQLTGKAITFGNFSLVPRGRLGNVLFNPGVWNNFAATMLRSRVPIEFVGTSRGTRYFGSSHMNFTMLMLHGMSAISVFSDVVIGRIIQGLIFLSGIFALGVGLTIYLKYGTQILVPGYATTVILILLSMLINALTIGFLSILALLAGRSQMTVHPTALLDAMLAKVVSVPPVRSAVSRV